MVLGEVCEDVGCMREGRRREQLGEVRSFDAKFDPNIWVVCILSCGERTSNVLSGCLFLAQALFRW